MPPMTTVASGRCTSAPALVDSAIGIKPKAATAAVISDRTQSCKRSFDHSSAKITTFFAQLIEIADHHDSVQTATPLNAIKPTAAEMLNGIRAATARKRPRNCQGNAGIDQQRLAHAAEGHKDQDEDEHQRRGHDKRQSRLGFAKILELSTKLERVSFRQFDVLATFASASRTQLSTSRPRRFTMSAARR